MEARERDRLLGGGVLIEPIEGSQVTSPLSSYARAMRCPAVLLRVWYAIPCADVAYAASRRKTGRRESRGW
eukprot:3685951-Rhodomonas_salina.8